jgi:hypothetical protein
VNKHVRDLIALFVMYCLDTGHVDEWARERCRHTGIDVLVAPLLTLLVSLTLIDDRHGLIALVTSLVEATVSDVGLGRAGGIGDRHFGVLCMCVLRKTVQKTKLRLFDYWFGLIRIE